MVRKEAEERLYKTYVTDMLKHIVNNSTGGEERVHVDTRYIDLADKSAHKPKKKEKPPETSDQIIARMKDKLSKLG